MKRISALLMTVGLSALLLSTLLVHSQGPSQGQDTSASKFRRSEKPIHGEYIVVLKESVARGNVDAVTTELATRHGGTTRFIYKDAIRGFSVRMPEAAALALSHDPRVSFVEENGEGSGTTTQGPPTPWALDRIDQAEAVGPVNDDPLSGPPFGTSGGTYSYNNTGAGVDVYVIDSGVRITHQEFEGRASLQRTFTTDGTPGVPVDYVGYDPNHPTFLPGEDCYGHGTTVAGIIGGKTYGVAKGVNIISMRVLDCDNNGTTARSIAAVNDVIGYGRLGARRVVNMSFQATRSLALDKAVDNLEGYGFLAVVSAGKGDGNAVNVSEKSPAGASVPLTVSATNWTDERNGFDTRTMSNLSFFNYGSGVDLFAPGFRIRGASSFDAAHAPSDTATIQGTGTSFAAPVVAGIAALYLENNLPTYPRFLSQLIKSNATIVSIGDAGPGSPNRMAYSILGPPMNPIDNAGFFVWRQYLDFYGCTTVPVDPNDPGGVKEYIFRAPNDTELSSDREQITSCSFDSTCIGNARVAVARARWDSAEFQQQPAVIADGLVTGIGSFNHHQFVRYCYLKYLQREPDPEGWAYWEGQLNLDNDYNHIIRAFISCPDYYGRFDASVNSLNTCGS